MSISVSTSIFFESLSDLNDQLVALGLDEEQTYYFTSGIEFEVLMEAITIDEAIFMIRGYLEALWQVGIIDMDTRGMLLSSIETLDNYDTSNVIFFTPGLKYDH